MPESSKKKILYVITQGDQGGAQKYLFDLATGQPAKNWQVEAAIGPDGGHDLNDKLTTAGIKIWPLQRLRRNISPLNDLLAVAELAKVYRSARPDVIHLNSSKAGVVGSLASWLVRRRLKHRLFYTAHGWVFNEALNPLKKQLYLWLEKITAAAKDAIICVSDFDRQTALNNKVTDEKKIITIYNGLDAAKLNLVDKNEARKKIINHQEWTLTARDFIVGTIANFYANKGLADLIEAANLLINENLPLKFIIIGDGELRPQLENLIASHQLADKIFLAGKISQASQLLQAFDLYVCSSLKEGLPYSILEAMAAGLPIVATKVGGIPEIIQDGVNGLLTAPAQPEQLAEKIKTLFYDPALSQRLVLTARQTLKETFSQRLMLEKTFQLYQK